MKNFLISTTAALLVTTGAVAAQSFAFEGAELSYLYSDSDDDYYGERYRGSAEGSVGPLGVQLDIGTHGYNGRHDYFFYTLHGNYRINDNLVAGLFYGQDDWDGDKYTSTGVEALYMTGPITVEGAFAFYTEDDGNDEWDILRLDGSYALTNQVSLLGHAVNTSGDDDLTILGLGARYDITNGVFAEANYAQFSGDYDHATLSLEIGYEFGGGTTFRSRDWTGLFGLY